MSTTKTETRKRKWDDPRAVRVALELGLLDPRMPDWAFDKAVADFLRRNAKHATMNGLILARILGPDLMLKFLPGPRPHPRGLRAKVESAFARVKGRVIARLTDDMSSLHAAGRKR